jgi:hypothetical protein
MPIHHVTYTMQNARNAQRKDIYMLPTLHHNLTTAIDDKLL